MKSSTISNLNKAKLKRWLGLFFLALFIPTVALVLQAYSQLKWEAFHQYSIQAEELAQRIDERLSELIREEDSRAFTDYAFLNVAGNPKANFLQRSPLSQFPVQSKLPGVLGYFQVDAEGRFSTPILPDAEIGYSLYGIPDAELVLRLEAKEKIHQILSENQLVSADADIPEAVFVEEQPKPLKDHYSPPAETSVTTLSAERLGVDDKRQKNVKVPAVPAKTNMDIEQDMAGQAAFDRLASKRTRQKSKKSDRSKVLGRISELKLDSEYQQQALEEAEAKPLLESKKQEKSKLRKERSVLAEAPAPVVNRSQSILLSKPELKVRIFESEIDEFRLSLLGSGHFVIYRNVWRDGQRYVQGALMEQGVLLEAAVKKLFSSTSLWQMSDLIVAYQGDVIRVFSGANERSYLSSAQELTGELLHRVRLSSPLNNMELLFSINHLPLGASQQLIHWVAGVLMFILVAGFFLLYRLAAKQLDLVKQQQDFVSAVSHELKTPLTSIRMYGEMLMQGWASEEKKKTYYAFIHDESERLSRLIANVLQLARMTRNELSLELTQKPVSELLDNIQSKIYTQVERAQFELQINVGSDIEPLLVDVDMDSFCQVIINLVDNAIKFSDKSDIQKIDLSAESYSNGKVVFKVRDYGPGIPKKQLKKIFELFYRPKNELTRETIGTGIGLALVRQLVIAMNGTVDVVNKEPGAEFRVILPQGEGPI